MIKWSTVISTQLAKNENASFKTSKRCKIPLFIIHVHNPDSDLVQSANYSNYFASAPSSGFRNLLGCAKSALVQKIEFDARDAVSRKCALHAPIAALISAKWPHCGFSATFQLFADTLALSLSARRGYLHLLT